MIQEILEKSGVHNIRVMGDDSGSGTSDNSSSEEVPFDFIGRKLAVENAILMLEYHLDHLKVWAVCVCVCVRVCVCVCACIFNGK